MEGILGSHRGALSLSPLPLTIQSTLEMSDKGNMKQESCTMRKNKKLEDSKVNENTLKSPERRERTMACT